MSLSPEDRRELTRLFMFVWVNCWSRYRGLIAVLEAHGLGPAERLEAEVETWMRAHDPELSREAVAKYDEFRARLDQG